MNESPGRSVFHLPKALGFLYITSISAYCIRNTRVGLHNVNITFKRLTTTHWGYPSPDRMPRWLIDCYS